MSTIPTNTDDIHRDDSLESEILVGRLIDGEATLDDQARFESLAGENPSLWRTLALRQQQMALLVAKFERDTHAVERIVLPRLAAAANRRGASAWLRAAAYSGWAALILLAAGWWFNARNSTVELPDVTPVITHSDPSLSYDDHLREYLQAPYVVGEMAPTLLHREVMSDGRTAIRFLRRVEEVLFLPAGQEPPTDQDGMLLIDELRSRSAGGGRPPSN